VAGIHWLGYCSRSCQRLGLCCNKALLSPSSVGLCSADGNVTHAAATFPPARRVLTPIIGAALATLVVWMMRRSAPNLHFEEYVEAVRFRNGRIPLLSTVWRTASSAFSVAHRRGDRTGRIDDPVRSCNLLMGRRTISSAESVVVAAGSLWRCSRGRGSLSSTDRRNLLRHGDRPG
jgi:hypothetical protein